MFCNFRQGFVNEKEIEVSKSGAVAKDLFGNTFDINEGIVKKVTIGNWESRNIKFASSPNEMESVSQQINTKFDAVIGWGYFGQYYTQIDYKTNKFVLAKNNVFQDSVLFKTFFNKNANYLNVPVLINDKEAHLIVDTGSPISLIDSSYLGQRKVEDIAVKMGEKNVPLNLQIQNFGNVKSN